MVKLSEFCANCGEKTCFCTRNGEVEGLFQIIAAAELKLDEARAEAYREGMRREFEDPFFGIGAAEAEVDAAVKEWVAKRKEQ